MGPLRVIFWGTRGLISSPRSETAIFGGNTSCIELRSGGPDLVLVDSGFGITNYGEILMGQILATGKAFNIHILYTHFHWDHIQGLPFFQPIYFPQTTLHLYSPMPPQTTHDNLNILFDGSYSPFAGIDSMPSDIKIHQLNGDLTINGTRIRYTEADHGPQNQDCRTFAYRFDQGDASVVLVSDHEARPSPRNDAIIQLANQCDLLIHDAQYQTDQYLKRVGWGHSTAEQALANAINCKARKTLLTHHDPARNDREIQHWHQTLRKQPQFRSLDFEFAREELEYMVQGKLHDAKKVS